MLTPRYTAEEAKIKLSDLLAAFKTDELSLEIIEEETELVRQELYQGNGENDIESKDMGC